MLKGVKKVRMCSWILGFKSVQIINRVHGCAKIYNLRRPGYLTSEQSERARHPVQQEK